MSKVFLAVLLALVVAGVIGCAAPSGSREYIPGSGWVHND
jgi:hypothetical protein